MSIIMFVPIRAGGIPGKMIGTLIRCMIKYITHDLYISFCIIFNT